MQVDPQQTIPLVYQIVDPFDTQTYYVRAVIKDSSSGTTITTVDLSSAGSGRYTGSFTAPQDPTGYGRHIDIVISIYVDSGYSEYSPDYQRRIDKYLVRRQSQSFGGGSGGADVDYLKIKKIVEDVVGDKVKPHPSLEPILEELGFVIRALERIRIPQIIEVPKTTVIKTHEKSNDLSPVVSTLKELQESMIALEKALKDKKEVPVNVNPADFVPVVAEIKKVLSQVGEASTLSSRSVIRIERLVNSLADEIRKVEKVGPIEEKEKKPKEKNVSPYFSRPKTDLKKYLK